MATDQKLQPLVKWAGGKRLLLRELLQQVPRKFNRYFEPFLGGAAFLLAIQPYSGVVGDANEELMSMYEAVRDAPDAVMAALDEMQPKVLDEEFYYKVRNLDPEQLTRPVRAARLIYLNKTCFNGLYRVNSLGKFNVPFGRYTTPPRLYERLNVIRISELFRRIDILSGDFEESLVSAGQGDFVYLDPPYVPLTATANFTRYTRNSFGEEQQRRLARVIHDLSERGCKVLLSNSDTPLTRELYQGYSITMVYAPRLINSDPTRRARVAELAIRNYELE